MVIHPNVKVSLISSFKHKVVDVDVAITFVSVVDPIQEEVFGFVPIGDVEVVVGRVVGVDIIRPHVGIY